MNVKFLAKYLVDRLSESSSWATILAFASVQMHINLTPELNTFATQLGVVLATGAGILLKEGWTNNK